MCMTQIVKCLAEKDIHSQRSVWPPCNPPCFVFVTAVSSSSGLLGPFPPSALSALCSQLTSYGPAVFHPALSNDVWDNMDGAGNPKEETLEATLLGG